MVAAQIPWTRSFITTTVRFHRHGSPTVLDVEDEVIGAPGPGQVRLRHEVIGVSPADTSVHQGLRSHRSTSVPGVSGAGIVEAVGPGVFPIGVGDLVAYFRSPGSYTQVRLIEADSLLKIPKDLSSEQVVAVLSKGLPAWIAINSLHRLRAGETVLVQGGSGSVGTLLARWAKARGAIVIGTARSEAKRLAMMGSIDHALLSDDPELAGRIRKLVPGGVDVVYDLIGQATFAASAAAVRDGGTIATLGEASGKPSINRIALAVRDVHVASGAMTQYWKGSMAKAVRDLFDAYRKGIFGALDVTRYPLAQAAQAHSDIASRRKPGAVVLIP